MLLIAAAEWRYWLRSYLAIGGALIFLVLIAATSLFTAVNIDAEKQARTSQQAKAEQTFLTQPDRHPHRMVHYGHYLFRAPVPLAIFDPGLDSVTGQSIFLEGHRQNTVMFAESAASADMGGLSWLTPALVYQLFAPLIIILLGYSAIARERDTASLASLLALGISGRRLIIAKALALFAFTVLLLLPLIISCMMAILNGENLVALLSLFAVYFIYLMVWALLTLIVSSALKKRASVLAVMIGLWFGFTLVLPSLAVNVVAGSESFAGKIETDLSMLSDLRKLGDGHNAMDPAFQKLQTDILKKYKVERIEDLPVNFRGIVAMYSEKKLTKVLNNYSNSRMDTEIKQEKRLAEYGWLTPALAIAFASRSIAGTDLLHYHRFQREAEAVRFSFVQKLNHSHVEKLSYRDDINRNKDEESGQRARLDASNWQVLDTYQFRTAGTSERIVNAFSSIQSLLVWLALAFGILLWFGGRIKP